MNFIIFILLIAFVIYCCNKGDDSKSNEKFQPSAVNLDDVTVSKEIAAQQIQRIKDAIMSGNTETWRQECDYTLDEIQYIKTLAGASAFLRVIEDASLMYNGARYPERRNESLDDLVRDEINKRRDNLRVKL